MADEGETGLLGLMNKYDSERVLDFYVYWFGASEKAVNVSNLRETTVISRPLLISMLRDCLVAIAKLDENDDNYSVKVWAYGIFYYLKYSPIQGKYGELNNTLYVNEKVPVCVLVSEFLPKTVPSEFIPIILNDLFVFFKNKPGTPQAIEEKILSLLHS